MKSTSIFAHLLSPFTDVESKISTKGAKLHILDGIRGLAVLIVIASHTRAFRMYGQGSLGVLLFFFLSGMVLTIPYASNPRMMTRWKEIALYFINRACRIIPLYIIMVGALALIKNQNFDWFWLNVSFQKGFSYLWSVAEEVRFYVLFPVVVWLLALVRRKGFGLVLLACLILLSFKYRELHMIDMMNGKHVHFYFYIFLAGSFTYLLATLPLSLRLGRNRLAQAFFIAAALAVFAFLFFSSTPMIEIFWKPLLPELPRNIKFNGWRMPGVWLVLFIVLFYSLLVCRKGPVYTLLTSYFFRHMGLLSYSLYLSHMMVIWKLDAYNFRNEGLFFAVLALSYVVALASYIIIEKPFLLVKKVLARTVLLKGEQSCEIQEKDLKQDKN